MKISDAISKIAVSYSELVNEITEKIISGNHISSYSQDEREASYSLWRDEEDYFIDWGNDACFIKRFIDAVGYPYKGATTLFNDKLVRILDAEEIEDIVVENRQVGKVVFFESDKPVVVCGKGLLKINEIVDEKQHNILPLNKFRIRFKKPL